MIALYIVLSVLLLIFLVMMLPLSLTVRYKDDVSLTASVLAVKFRIYPKKKKKIKISDYSKKKLLKRRKKALKAKQKALKKQKSLPHKKAPGAVQSKSLTDNLELIYKLISTYINKSVKHVKIKTTRIILTVGSDDAAKTALLYAAVNNAVLLLLTYLDSFNKLKNTAGSDISVNADFTSEKCSADVEISFSMRVWQIAESIFAAALKYVKLKSEKQAKG